MIWVWEWFIHWLARGLITIEERELYREEARRLKLKTDLQEERIKRRRAVAAQYTLVATWRHNHMRQPPGKAYIEVISIFYLEQSEYERRVRPGPVVNMEGKVIAQAKVGNFEVAQPVWARLIQPWLDGTLPPAKLKHHPEFVLPGV